MRYLLSVVIAASALAAQSSQSDSIEEAIRVLADITGLEPLKKVDHGTISRDGVRRFLEERIAEEIKPEDIRIDELALKRFGFVPADFDLKQTTIDLITEQAAAFYDYRRKKLFLLEASDQPTGMAALAQETILIHELAHALADQHFNLSKFIRHGRSDDASTARLAVMEGQATWLMLEAMARRAGHSVREMPKMVDMMSSSLSESMLAQYPVMAKAPLYIRASLIFPYNQGLQFQHAVLQKLGNEGFSKVFRDAPVSTQQVLHPDLYLNGTRPLASALPVLAKPRDWKTLTDSTAGEFDHAILLEQYLTRGDAEALAQKWRGGRFGLVEHKREGRVVMLYSSEWADEESAKRMFDAYRTVLERKSTKAEFASESDTELTGTGDHGMFRVIRLGTRIAAVEGVATLDDIRRQLN